MVGVGGLVVGTLLGPEGAGCCGLLLLEACWMSYRPGLPGAGGVSVVGHLPYFENCTVDASIL